MFKSRGDAAQKLAKALAHYRGQHPLILAIPRGAIAMGRVLADELEGELDVVLVRKLSSPVNAEFAIGSIDESGWCYLAPHANASDDYLETEKRRQLNLLKQRRSEYTPNRAPAPIEGRVAIVVDDGLATGATMIAALHAARARKPKTLICAVPVAAPDSLERVRAYADETVCLAAPDDFYAVGQFYSSFPQVDDSEVVRLLSAGGRRGA